MAETPDLEARVAALESRIETVAADATAARHLAASGDRDLADLTTKVDANRAVINALGQQSAARFDQLDQRFDQLEQQMAGGFRQVDERFAAVDAGFAEMRGKLDQAAAGQQQIVDLIGALLEQDGGDR